MSRLEQIGGVIVKVPDDFPPLAPKECRDLYDKLGVGEKIRSLARKESRLNWIGLTMFPPAKGMK